MSVAALRFHWVARATQLAGDDGRRGAPGRGNELRKTWGYVDHRDAARACRLAIETAADRPYGFVAMNIVAADTLAPEPIGELLAEHAPEVEIGAARADPGGVRHHPRRRGDRLAPGTLLARPGLSLGGASGSAGRRGRQRAARRAIRLGGTSSRTCRRNTVEIATSMIGVPSSASSGETPCSKPPKTPSLTLCSTMAVRYASTPGVEESLPAPRRRATSPRPRLPSSGGASAPRRIVRPCPPPRR